MSAVEQKAAGAEAHIIRVETDAGGSAEFSCREGQSVLAAMEQAGLAIVPVGCRGGGCGVCRVAVDEGDVDCGKMSRAHVSETDETSRAGVLACRVYPRSGLSIRPSGKLFKKIEKRIAGLEQTPIICGGK